MKPTINKTKSQLIGSLTYVACLLLLSITASSQEDSTAATDVTTEPKAPVQYKPVKNTFQSVWIIDNQTVLVPAKGTLEMDIMHRFGTVENGYEDFWGFFAPSNIRLAMSYAPINKLFVGFGIFECLNTYTILMLL